MQSCSSAFAPADHICGLLSTAAGHPTSADCGPHTPVDFASRSWPLTTSVRGRGPGPSAEIKHQSVKPCTGPWWLTRSEAAYCRGISAKHVQVPRLSKQSSCQAARAPVAALVRRSRRWSLPCHTEACMAPWERSWAAAPQRRVPKQDAARRTGTLPPSSQLRPGRRMPALQQRKCNGVNAAVQARHAMQHQCKRQLIIGTSTSYRARCICAAARRSDGTCQ